MTIYLDNASTTKQDARVTALVAEMSETCYGNDSSPHAMGVGASRIVERARVSVADAICAEPEEIIFTSGGTESNNLAILGAARGRHMVISGSEHPSVHNTALRAAKPGCRVTVIKPGRDGLVRPCDIAEAIRPETALVSVIHAGNETGAIEPLEEIGAICRKRGVLFHSDACQSFTKVKIDARRLRVDLLTLNSHKVHGPKGAGALFVRKGVRLEQLMSGGGQEAGLRPGTTNCPAIAGFGLAVELSSLKQAEAISALRDRLWARLGRGLPGARLNCRESARVCGILSVILPGSSGAAGVVRALSRKGIYISAGSACSSGKNEPSRILMNLGLSGAEALRTIRISLSRFNTAGEVVRAADEIAAQALAGIRGKDGA